MTVRIALLAVLVSLGAPASAQPDTRFTTANVRLREGPSTATAILAVIPRGTPVAAGACADRWCAATHAGLEGFVSARYLSTPATTEPPSDLTPFQEALLAEHVFGGLPACSPPDLLIRRGYVNCFDPTRRVARWVAFRVTPDYLDGPPREDRFDSFRSDPDIVRPVRDPDYTNSGYDRGHLAPFAVMGGDRDGDGRRATLAAAASDPDDEATIFESNYMSNIAPQRGRPFNQSSGIWWKVESFIQNTLVRDAGREAWVFAGPVFGPGVFGTIGPDRDIEVPPMFFQIVVREPEPPMPSGPPIVLAFLLPHHQAPHGQIEDYLVSVDVVEALTGLDFFSELPDTTERQLEVRDTWEHWDDH